MAGASGLQGFPGRPTKVTKPSFSAHRNAVVQTLADSTWTKLKFTHTDWNVGGFFKKDVAANANENRFKPLIAGKYLVTCCVTFDALAAGEACQVAIYKNGVIHKTLFLVDVTTGTGDLGFNGSVVVDLDGVSDYIELYAIQYSGGNLDVEGDIDQTYFQAMKVSD